MTALRQEELDQLLTADHGDVLVAAEADRLTVLKAAQDGVVGQRWNKVAALDAGRPPPGGRCHRGVAEMKISTAQPLHGFITVEYGLREIDCGEVSKGRHQYVRQFMRRAHDVEGPPDALGRLTSEVQVPTRPPLISGIAVQRRNSGRASPLVLEAEGGQ
jgi:hypothetical protein